MRLGERLHLMGFRGLVINTTTLMGPPVRNELIIKKTLSKITELESFHSKPLCHVLSKAFDIYKAITLLMNLFSRALLILCVIRVRTSAVDLEVQNLYCLSLRRLFLLR